MTTFDFWIGLNDLACVVVFVILAANMKKQLREYTNGYRRMRVWLFLCTCGLLVVNLMAALYDFDCIEMTEYARAGFAVGRDLAAVGFFLMFNFKCEE